MTYKFTEVLNDLINYFILGDILLLETILIPYCLISPAINQSCAKKEVDCRFVIQAADGEKPVKADMNLSFKIKSSTY